MFSVVSVICSILRVEIPAALEVKPPYQRAPACEHAFTHSFITLPSSVNVHGSGAGERHAKARHGPYPQETQGSPGGGRPGFSK